MLVDILLTAVIDMSRRNYSDYLLQQQIAVLARPPMETPIAALSQLHPEPVHFSRRFCSKESIFPIVRATK